MKKYLLIILFLTSLNYGKAQITLSNTTTQYYSNDNTALVEAVLSVNNNNTYPVDISVRRIIDVLTPGHEESFCFGEYCYLPGTDSSQYATTVAADTTEESFKADLNPMGLDGYDRIHYIFYDSNNVADSASITIEFFINSTGIDSYKEEAYLHFSNPVNNFTVLSYGFPSSFRDSRIEVHNMLGSKINSIRVNDKKGVTVMPTGNLANGIYLVSLVNNNKFIKTYKMMVNHNN